jgi:hypothetical protein
VLFVGFSEMFEKPQELFKDVIDFLKLNGDVIPEKLEKITRKEE